MSRLKELKSLPPGIPLPLSGVLTSEHVKKFRAIVYEYYDQHGRSFAWRQAITPYRVVVSEIMLQQTQTDRVSQKFDDFVEAFPDFQTLAQASFEHVLRYWKGLGYNRRAQALQKIARLVVDEFNGVVPDDPKILETFPGIGPATAASIVVYAFNKPMAFIETNIRTVFIYTFFHAQVISLDLELDQQDCLQRYADATLRPLVDATLDKNNPRAWFYALMDYGVMLKKTIGNVSRLSAHYAKQSRFEGSDRQIRGRILQALLDMPGIGDDELCAATRCGEFSRVMRLANDLVNEGFVCIRGSRWWLVQ